MMDRDERMDGWNRWKEGEMDGKRMNGCMRENDGWILDR